MHVFDPTLDRFDGTLGLSVRRTDVFDATLDVFDATLGLSERRASLFGSPLSDVGRAQARLTG